MRTTIVVERYPAISETFVVRHAQYFNATVVCRQPDSGEYFQEDVRVLAPPETPQPKTIPGCFRLRRLLNRIASPRRNFIWNTSMEKFWTNYLDSHHPQVVLAEFAPNALSALPACRARGIPLVAHFHGYDASSLMTRSSYRRTVKEVFRDAAAVVCVSTFMKNQLLQAGCPRHKLHVIPCGTDLSEFRPSYRVSGQPCRFVAVSRLEAVKGPLITLEGFRRVHAIRPEVTLDWIGGGSLRVSMEEFIRRHHLEGSVRMHGALRHAQVRAILEQSSVLVQASLTHTDGAVEGWGISIAEALATGLPAVVTRSGGMVELVLDGHNGFLFEEGNAIAMSHAMLKLADHPTLRIELGRNGRLHVEQVGDARRSLQLLEQVLRNACGVAYSAAPVSEIAC
jgi:colanic acid/amylovoran biosynthesis glycosyltransferase